MKTAFKKCQAFAGLSDNHIDRLAAIAEEKEYSAGATLFQEGSYADELLVVEEGKVALQMTLPKADEQSPRRVTVDIVNSNELVDWASIVEPFVNNLAAVCLQKTKVVSINALVLRMLLNSDPLINQGVTKGLVKVLEERLATTRQLLVSERQLTPAA